MCYVVRKSDNKILNRIDAWAVNSVETMERWIAESGYTMTSREITFSGDMVLWVE